MRFKTVLCSSLLLLTVRVGMAAPCSYITSHPDTWVNHKIDSLVRSARGAFDEESGELAFERLVRAIAVTLDRCKLVDDVAFVGRHNVFIDYIRMSALTTR